MTDALTCAHCEGDIHLREHHHRVTTDPDEGNRSAILHFHARGACNDAAFALYRRGGGIRLFFGRRLFDNKIRG